MITRKQILFINGSASQNSSNHQLLIWLTKQFSHEFEIQLFDSLKSLPHFDPELSIANTPEIVIDFRNRVNTADGIVICTPEYIFSIPSGLKNALEWCVSTTVFSSKPTGIITASASGIKGHQELQMIMETIMAKTSPSIQLLIQGIKGKVNQEGEIVDDITMLSLTNWMDAFKKKMIEIS